jgi:hypothetical protein
MTIGIVDRLTAWVPPQFGADFDGRFVSRKAAKNAKEKACGGSSAPSLEDVSSATEFRLLRVLRGFA